MHCVTKLQFHIWTIRKGLEEGANMLSFKIYLQYLYYPDLRN